TSKMLAPGLRVGFIVAPDALVPRIAAAIRGTTWMAAPLMAEIAAEWIDDGTAEQILSRKRKEAAARQRLAARALERFEIQTRPDSYRRGLHVPRPWRSETFAEAARRSGVAVTPAAAFAVARAGVPEAVRVCLGGARDRGELERALHVLAGLLGSAPEAPVA